MDTDLPKDAPRPVAEIPRFLGGFIVGFNVRISPSVPFRAANTTIPCTPAQELARYILQLFYVEI